MTAEPYFVETVGDLIVELNLETPITPNRRFRFWIFSYLLEKLILDYLKNGEVEACQQATRYYYALHERAMSDSFDRRDLIGMAAPRAKTRSMAAMEQCLGQLPYTREVFLSPRERYTLQATCEATTPQKGRSVSSLFALDRYPFGKG